MIKRNDNVSLLCAYRGGTAKNTSYHFLLDEDEEYNFLETGQWYANTDDPLSMCLTAHMTYTSTDTSISNADTKDHAVAEVYTIDGVKANAPHSNGIYIIRQGDSVRKVLVK